MSMWELSIMRMIFVVLILAVGIRGDDADNDAVVVHNRALTKDSNDPQTRIFTDNKELNAGIGGAIIGAGGALLVSHLLNQNKRKNCHYRIRRDDSGVETRLFGLGGNNNNNFNCPPPYYPPQQPHYPPRQPHYPPQPYHPPQTTPYYPPQYPSAYNGYQPTPSYGHRGSGSNVGHLGSSRHPSNNFNTPTSGYTPSLNIHSRPTSSNSLHSSNNNNNNNNFNNRPNYNTHRPSNNYNTHRPSNNYNTPSNNYNTPSNNYNTPSNNYNRPSNNYNNPSNNYPTPGYNQPQFNNHRNPGFVRDSSPLYSPTANRHDNNFQGQNGNLDFLRPRSALPDDTPVFASLESEDNNNTPAVRTASSASSSDKKSSGHVRFGD